MHKQENTNEVISVIIPIYNVASYLDKCVKSIITQTYANLEIIMVDDGSPDNCPAICDAWEETDGRIKVIHKSNGGLSDARNAGIDLATGDYLLFVDADDYIAPDMCEKLLAAIKREQADMAVCNFYWDYPTYRKRNKMRVRDGSVIERCRILETWVRFNTVDFVVAWNKLYKWKLFDTEEHIRYPLGKVHEDEFTTYRLLYAAEKTVFINEPLYFYVQRDGSIMGNYKEKHLQDYAEAVRGYIPWVDKIAPQKRKIMENMVMRNTLEVIKRGAYNPQFNSGKKISEQMKLYADSEVNDYLMNPYINWQDWIKYIMYKLGLWGMRANIREKTKHSI